jgi:predicted amidohydrolase YtcJ
MMKPRYWKRQKFTKAIRPTKKSTRKNFIADFADERWIAQIYHKEVDFMKALLLIASASLCISSFAQKKKADLILHNAKIYTVDARFSVASAMAVKDGKVLEVGESKKLLAAYSASEKVDAGGKAVYPGFIDAHAHFLRYGLGLQNADLVNTETWEDVLKRLQAHAQKEARKPGEWIIGRGWDQNDWPVKEYPTAEKLDELFPDNPVYMTRVDGHAAIANSRALHLAGVTPGTKLTGGEVEVKAGKLTGILIDNAQDLVESKIPAPSVQMMSEAFKDAQAACFAVGLTGVDDCGVSYREALLMDSLQKLVC